MAWAGNKPVEMPAGGVGQIFRDWIPEEEQDLYPGQGMGDRGPDWIPEDYTPQEWVEEQAAKRRLVEIERARTDRRTIAGGAATAERAAAAEPGTGAAEVERPAAAGARESITVENANGSSEAATQRVRGRGHRG